MRARGYVSVHGCVSTCISVSACARPLAAGKKPEDIHPGGEIRLSFWPRAFPRSLQRVTEGDGKLFQAAGAAARQLHVAQAGGTVAPGWGSRGHRWPGSGAAAWGRSSSGRSGDPCAGEQPSPGCLALRVARLGAGRALSLGRPREGSPVVGDWPPPPSAYALSPTQLAPSRVGGCNSVALNLGRTRRTFVSITNPDAAAPSEGRACFWPHPELSPAAPRASSGPAKICTNVLSPSARGPPLLLLMP